MRIIIVLFLLSQSFLSYSQFHVGDSKEAVKSYLISKDVEYTEQDLSDTTSRISVLDRDTYQMIWVLDSDDMVTRQTLIPEGKYNVNDFVRWFNDDFVMISDAQWRNYENGKIYVIRLEHIWREPFFSITLSMDSE